VRLDRVPGERAGTSSRISGGAGAKLDLEAAAGVGRLDFVQRFFNSDRALTEGATRAQMQRGFLWACEYGRNPVVEFLLDHGADLNGMADTCETVLT
jgi:ankyrin repeat protein